MQFELILFDWGSTLARVICSFRRFVIIALTAQAIAAEPIAITIDAGQVLQRIDGFGTSTFGGFELLERGNCDAAVPPGVTYHTTVEQRRKMVETAVRELGVTHLRMWLYGSAEGTNDNDDPEQMNWSAFNWKGHFGEPPSKKEFENRDNGLDEWGDVLKVAVPLGLKNWIVTPGNLPPWLHERMDDPAEEKRFDEYAEWAAAHLLYLKKTFGYEAPYWSMFNEPDNLDWIEPVFWVQWIKATGRRFKKEKLGTKIMFPDYMNVHRAVELVPKVLADEEVRSYVGALAYHHYRSSGDGPQPFLKATSQPATADAGELFYKLTRGAKAMAQLGKRFGIPSWQTETAYYPRNVAGLSEWEIGRGRANEIYYELISGAQAVQGMLMVWVDALDPRYNLTVAHEGHHIIIKTDGKNMTDWSVSKTAGAVFAHYARFVGPDDHRILAVCRDPMLRVSAFISEKNKRCVVVVVNNSDRPKDLHIRLEHLPMEMKLAGGLMTDETRTLIEHSITIVPPLSLCTFVWAHESMPTLTLPKDIHLR